MKIKFALLFLLSFSMLQAQDSISKKLPPIHLNEKLADSLKLILIDYQKTKTIDSTWQTRVGNQDLFTQMKHLLTESSDTLEFNSELDTNVLKSRLNELNQRTPFDINYNPSLERVIQMYLNRDPKFTHKLYELSQLYFPLFEEVFDKHNVPLEMKYLAVVESALNPRAKSPVGATGLWQFMYRTGLMYDLEVSSYVDERMDPIKSTEAAAQYLNLLYSMFEDWDLALAAYNSGPGNVNKAIRRSGGNTDYWELRRFLPRETAGYVPSFIAIMYIFEYAEELGITTNKKEVKKFYTDTLHVKDLIKIDHVAEVLELDQDFIKSLNPAYKLGIIPFEENKNNYIKLPYAKAQLFAANEEEIYGFTQYKIETADEKLPENKKMNEAITYRVQSGDFLGKIAERHKVLVRDIKRWNKLTSDQLKIGQKLIIYPKSPEALHSASSSKPLKEGKEQNESKKETFEIYKVKERDSLWKIAKQHPEVSIEDIKKNNNLKSVRLKPGMELKI